MFRSTYKLLGWTILIVLIDQLTKFIVSQTMTPFETKQILGDVLRLTFIKNPGMAFGIRIGNHLFFTVFSTIASVVILIYLFRMRPENVWARLALASILGGAIGNLIDRLLHKEVIDFIDVRIIRWPVFNVADIAVTVGMVILIGYVIFDHHELDVEEETL
ncbi:MAG: signal peptidase II [Calditrichaeota bacterium]|nr:signal peptidase II [Calditrichota bacterium]